MEHTFNMFKGFNKGNSDVLETESKTLISEQAAQGRGQVPKYKFNSIVRRIFFHLP